MSLDPDDALVRTEYDALAGWSIPQVHRSPDVRRIDELAVPCPCGFPRMAGLEADLLVDAAGWSIAFTGVCLKCGTQRAFYVSAPRAQSHTDDEAERRRITDQITRGLVEQVILRRRAEDESDEQHEHASETQHDGKKVPGVAA